MKYEVNYKRSRHYLDLLARQIHRILRDTVEPEEPPIKARAGKTTTLEDGSEVVNKEDFNTAISRMDHATIREHWSYIPTMGLLRYDQRSYIPPHDGARTQILHTDPP